MTCAVVDWEFAGIGRGVNCDLAQMLAHFALFHTAARHRGESQYERELYCIATTMIRSYRQISEEEHAPWTRTFDESSAGAFPQLDPRALRAKMLRSAFLTHGIEIMRCAFGKVWRCDDSRCTAEGTHTTEKHKCVLIQKMVERAIWYFRHAGNDEEEFCSGTIAAALTKARNDGQWLLDLF